MRLRKILFLFACMMLSFVGASSNNLIKFKNHESAIVGIFIQNLKSGEVIASQNHKVAMTPASVTKSVTLAGAMFNMDMNFCYNTFVSLSGDTINRNGMVNSDLLVFSSADPTLESEHFTSNMGFVDSIVAAIKESDIKTINGRIIIKTQKHVSDFSSSWMLEDVAWDYGAGYRDFNYKDNAFKLYYNTADSTYTTSVCIPNLEVSMSMLSGDKQSVNLSRAYNSEVLSVCGYYKSGSNRVSLSCSTPDVRKLFVSELKSRLSQQGIEVTDSILTDSYCEVKPIYTHVSPPIKDIMRSMMVRSDNMFADAVLHCISSDNAIDTLIKTFESRGINCDCISLYDGCGLSRVDRLTPEFINGVYRLMYHSNHIDDYLATFPRSGIDGTLSAFCKGTKLEGRLALKTGSMGGVQCYGGYKVNDQNEPTHSIVIMVNNFFCKRSELRKAIQNFLLKIF